MNGTRDEETTKKRPVIEISSPRPARYVRRHGTNGQEISRKVFYSSVGLSAA